MKKIIALVLTALLALSLVACGSKSDNGGSGDASGAETIKLGGVGPLTGAGVPCSGRMNVTFRSTWSKGSSIIDAHMGGHIGPMLK